MQIVDKFKAQDFYEKLHRRGDNFAQMVDHVANSIGLNMIVETGTAHDKGNWGGQGQSTLLWDWLAEEMLGLRVYSLDIRPKAIETAAAQTKHVKFLLGDSIVKIQEVPTPEQIALLYLDSYDWTQELNLESAMHHFMELAGIFAKLSTGCMVVVDDRAGDFKGKHWVVEEYFKRLNIAPAFKNYQIGWVLP